MCVCVRQRDRETEINWGLILFFFIVGLLPSLCHGILFISQEGEPNSVNIFPHVRLKLGECPALNRISMSFLASFMN